MQDVHRRVADIDARNKQQEKAVVNILPRRILDLKITKNLACRRISSLLLFCVVYSLGINVANVKTN